MQRPNVFSQSVGDAGPLLNPPREPPPWAMAAIDTLSWLLPVAAAVLSIWGGLEALRKSDDLAAVLGIAGGIASALGVLFTGWASRIRDGRLAVAYSVGALGVDMANMAQAQNPHNF